jgi:hypothetical protein
LRADHLSTDIRAFIELLATHDARYVLVCVADLRKTLSTHARRIELAIGVATALDRAVSRKLGGGP